MSDNLKISNPVFTKGQNLWRIRIYNNGKLIKTIRSKDKTETEKRAKEYAKLIDKKINIDWQKASVNDLIEDFISTNKENWEISTYNWYYDILKHIKNNIGEENLWDITTEDLNWLLKDLAKNNPNTGRPASKRLLFCVTNVTKQLFKYAAGKRYIEYDPAVTVKTPKRIISDEEETERKGTRVLTLEEIGWIIYTPHELQTANMIMLYTGMRSEELLALQWKDINIKEKTITVNKAVKYDKDKPYLGKTKTGKKRTVIMPPDLYEHIKKVYPKKELDKLVVCNSKGEYFSKSGWRSKYKSYIKDLDVLYSGKGIKKYSPYYEQTIQGWSPYSLRHTSSTYGALFGVNKKQLADNQGHDEKTMNKFYEGELFELRKKEIEKVSFKEIAVKPDTESKKAAS